MTINITPEIQAAYDAYLNEPVDADFNGGTIRRRDTHPFNASPFDGMVDFAAGFQAARTHGVAPCALCAKGFPIKDGEHYGTQALGIIPATRCTAGVKASHPGDALGRCFDCVWAGKSSCPHVGVKEGS